MNIANAKQQIKNAVTIYLQKDALGRYEVPLVHQRPIFLQGSAGPWQNCDHETDQRGAWDRAGFLFYDASYKTECDWTADDCGAGIWRTALFRERIYDE